MRVCGLHGRSDDRADMVQTLQTTMQTTMQGAVA